MAPGARERMPNLMSLVRAVNGLANRNAQKPGRHARERWIPVEDTPKSRDIATIANWSGRRAGGSVVEFANRPSRVTLFGRRYSG